MPKVAVVIPARNEQDSIDEVLTQVMSHFEADIIVVDDASHDLTPKICKQKGIILLSLAANLGAWRATQAGLRYCFKHNYDFVITMDADGQHPPNSMSDLLARAQQGFDLVIGSCISRGSHGRHLTWKLFKLVTRLNVSDLTSGFRCYSKNALAALSAKQATAFEYQDVGVLLMLRNLRLNITEIDVHMSIRKNGISRIFFSWLAVCQYLIYTSVLSLTKTIPMRYASYKRMLNKGSDFD